MPKSSDGARQPLRGAAGLLSITERKQITDVRDHLRATVPFLKGETDTEYGYRYANAADSESLKDPTIGLFAYHAIMLDGQSESRGYNAAEKRAVEKALKQESAEPDGSLETWRLTLREYPVTGPGGTRDTVGEAIDNDDEDMLRSAFLHIVGNIRGQQLPLNIYAWALDCIQSKRRGDPEPSFKEYGIINEDAISALVGRIGDSDDTDDLVGFP